MISATIRVRIPCPNKLDAKYDILIRNHDVCHIIERRNSLVSLPPPYGIDSHKDLLLKIFNLLNLALMEGSMDQIKFTHKLKIFIMVILILF